MNAKTQLVLDFVPTQPTSKANIKLFFICDSYLGADQEFDLPLRIQDLATTSSSDKTSGRGERKRKHHQEDVKG